MVQWRGRRQSENIHDVRGQRYRRAAGGAAMLPFILRIFGWRGLVGVALVLGLIWAAGGDLRPLADALTGGSGAPVATQGEIPPGQEAAAEFAAVILADTEDAWREIFAQEGLVYPEPRMTLYSGAVPSACGFASSAIGPFYCPGDNSIYLDLTFFDDLANRLGARGEFAPAYVIAHEVGHHIQNILGVLQEAERARAGLSGAAENRVQVQVELMADCFAGVWANHADRMAILEPGDIEAGMEAAAAVGDDTLQRRAGGQVVPDSFTHGTSAQRTEWFLRGYESGRMRDCDTFANTP